MYSRAFWKYYNDSTVFNLPFSLIFCFLFGLLWGLIIFSSVGIVIGYLGFKNFKENEYYTYNNLGFTKANLLKQVCIVNCSLSIPIILMLIIVS